jgi:hypothetical protein
LVLGICFVPLVSVIVLAVSISSPDIVDTKIGVAAIAFGWLFWAFAVAYTTPRDRFDFQTFWLTLVFFPVMYPACLLLLLGLISMRHRFSSDTPPHE